MSKGKKANKPKHRKENIPCGDKTGQMLMLDVHGLLAHGGEVGAADAAEVAPLARRGCGGEAAEVWAPCDADCSSMTFINFSPLAGETSLNIWRR